MIITPSERRRAEEFEALLQEQSAASGADLPMLELSSRLRTMESNVEVDPVFRDRLRMRLMAVATVQGIGEESPRLTRSERHRPVTAPSGTRRRIALVAGTVTALAALTGVGAASTGAVPGDTLYNVKRSREAAQLALARSDISRGQLHLEFARTRALEALTVKSDDQSLRTALDDMDDDTRLGMRDLGAAATDSKQPAALDIVDEFVAVQRRQLISLISAQPRDKRARPTDSLVLLEDVRERSGVLRATLECDSYLGAKAVDQLGVLPRRCAALPGHREPDERTSPPATPNGHGVQPSAKPRTTPNPDEPSTEASPGLDGVLPDLPTTNPSGGTGDVLDGITGTLTGANPTPEPNAYSSDVGSGLQSTQSDLSMTSLSGGTGDVLDNITGTVGGVIGGVTGPFGDSGSTPVLP